MFRIRNPENLDPVALHHRSTSGHVCDYGIVMMISQHRSTDQITEPFHPLPHSFGYKYDFYLKKT